MADLDKRVVGPFTGKQLVIGLGGGGALYLGIRLYRSRQAAAATAAQTALGGGSTIPAGTPGAGATGATAAAPGTLAEWTQAAIASGGIPTLNAITNWLAGNCVDAGGYSGLSSAIATLGLPPGMVSFPVLTVCANGNQGGSSTPSTPAGGSSSGGSGGSSAAAGGGSSATTPNQPAAAIPPVTDVIAPGQRILSTSTIFNPVPLTGQIGSLLDQATTQGGGLVQHLVSIPDAGAGASYTLYPTAPVASIPGTPSASPSLGPIINSANAIPGERYQPVPGRPGFIQVIN